MRRGVSATEKARREIVNLSQTYKESSTPMVCATASPESGALASAPAGTSSRPLTFAWIRHHNWAKRVKRRAISRVSQVWLVRRFGPDVTLGNIAPGDVLALETLRLGLRSDTLGLPRGEH